MEWFEYLIILAAAAFVITVIVVSIRNRINGKSSCSECSMNCPSCGKTCHKFKNKSKLLKEYRKANYR